MARKIIAGTYTFVDEPEKLLQFTLPTNILFDDNNGTVINYTTAPLSGITTNKFVLAVDRPNEAQRYLVYAFEDTTAAGGALSVSKGWYWFNPSSTSLDAISTPSVVFSDNCSINNELTTPEANALFTTSPIQVQPTVTTTRVLYKGKKELTMAQFEALASLDDAIDYDITDFPNGGITNAQMTAALGYSRLFEDGEIYVCSDNGTYKKGNWYQIKVEGGVKSWEDITKGLKIYPVTDILNHDGIKSGTFTEEQINNIKLADILQVYCIDGDPIYKYAYKGLYPTNPAQSTIGANLYFVAATEKGNYVLAINMTTRNWEVREPVSVKPLYKHELVIPYSFSVGDSETVNGSVVYHYLSNTGTQITSASEIDDNFLLSGGIGKNTANTVLLLNITVIKAGSSITVEAVNASTMGYITGTVGTITDTVTQLI